MPVPALSFAIRHHKCAVGIMITASHNSYEYNGYKVYDENGCQITDNVATEILKNMEQVDIFDDSLHMHKGGAKPTSIGDETKDAFCEAVLKQQVTWASEDEMQKDIEKLSIVYTPLNGAGNIPVRQVLNKIGLKNINIVREQELPDGNFPTCMYPNPEKKEALKKGLQMLKEVDADILIATDPDGDRIGVAVKTSRKKTDGERTCSEDYVLNGNEIGLLLFDFICDMKSRAGQMSKSPIAARTLVSSKMFDSIARQYGVAVKVTPTGFKYIGEFITELEKQGRINDYIFGFEESHGYLSGTYVRDKDSTSSAMLVCQMAAYYKKQNKTLLDRLDELHEKHGYFLNHLVEFVFEGEKGANKMAEIMETLRDKSHDPVKEIAGKKVIKAIDFKESLEFPNLNVLEFVLEDGGGLVIRPSGTEPKLKIYLTARGHSKESAKEEVRTIEDFIDHFLKNSLQI
jgi:phosphoglucomutase